MIRETLTLLAQAMSKATEEKVVVGDLARQPSPPNKILITLLSQEIANPNEARPSRTESQLLAKLIVVVGCCFRDYDKALAALDSAWRYSRSNPRLRLSPDDDPIMLNVLSLSPEERATYWSTLGIPPVPSVFLQIHGTLEETPNQGGLPILKRPPLPA